ncbi:DUF1484 family protein [Deefgea sp. CFH1-16]|uniref:DUF1484 family protein n=1 Tax=Deefgea sp. CFH1-16 TaxID=2675457 RepID=UPI0015F4BDF8|nr:DUF1484 family protein [Deefgea sp. CFH1-16]MBM5575587.1 DUF1484 family protein [Deefgea sp. CFH1-16]
MCVRPYQLPATLPSNPSVPALRFEQLTQAIDGLQRGVAHLPDGGSKKQLSEHAALMQAQNQQLIDLLERVRDELILCEDGLLALAELLESSDTRAMPCSRLHSLLTPLLQRQHEANNYLADAL